VRRRAQKQVRSSRFIARGEEHLVISFPLVPAEISEALSQGELEVVLAVLGGKSNREIGAQRGTSERTVANQLASIYRKLGIGSRRELVARCMVSE
jgi:DNA-binding CsgD family transcriptional regulator